MSKKLIGSNVNNLCKIFIKKRITMKAAVYIIANSNDLFKQLNRDLYSAVRTYNQEDYFFSQSYWDRYDKTLLFTDSYWLDHMSCSEWLNSKTRQDIIDKYSHYFDVETSYNILIDKMADDVPLL